MDIDILKDALRSWMKVGTWYTGHPLDEQRFHKALSLAFDRLGSSIDADSIQKAMTDLYNELYPGGMNQHFEGVIERHAGKAEIISNYLYDLSH